MKSKKINKPIFFIDHHILATGELISGQYPSALIDFPTYRFDPDTRILQGMEFKIDKKLIAIYGDGISLSGAAGGGISTMLFGIYKLPFTSQGYDTPQITIFEISENGTVELEYRKENISLKIGEKWKKIFTKIEEYDQNQQKGSIKLIQTDEIINYGFLDRSKINLG